MRKIFEHTADVGIKVECNTLSEAFNELSLSFTEIVTGGNLTTKQKSYEITIVSEDLESLLVRFLSHLIFLFDTKNFLPSSAEVDVVISDSCEINGQILGDSYDEEKHGYGVEVKAVSYHMLEISVGPPSTIVIILDL
ncbi:MAG: archease [Candidatus Poseidoniales archaeon]